MLLVRDVSETRLTTPNAVRPAQAPRGYAQPMSSELVNSAEVRRKNSTAVVTLIEFVSHLGEGYYGITRCADGLRCFARSQYYSLCAATCPGAGWVC